MQKQNQTKLNWTLWIGLLVLIATELIHSKAWELPKTLHIILIASSIILLIVGLALDVKKFFEARREGKNNKRKIKY